jgi:hypothetical protein
VSKLPDDIEQFLIDGQRTRATLARMEVNVANSYHALPQQGSMIIPEVTRPPIPGYFLRRPGSAP